MFCNDVNNLFCNSSQHLQDELAERSVQLEKVKKAGKVLSSTQESLTLKAADINTNTGSCISCLMSCLF